MSGSDTDPLENVYATSRPATKRREKLVMRQLWYGPAQGHVEWIPVDPKALNTMAVYRVHYGMDWTVGASRKCSNSTMCGLATSKDAKGMAKMHAVDSFARWLVKTKLYKQSSWLRVLSDLERATQAMDENNIVFANWSKYDPCVHEMY